MRAIAAVVIAALALLGALAPQCSAAQDDITEEGANGTAVVLLSVARIRQSGIFASDNGLLRRIAYVETRDGTDPATYREEFDGGIWAVTESAFRDTKNTINYPRLPAKLLDIKDHFGIEWAGVEWNDLRKPLYSAIAARLVLYNVPVAIPEANDIQAQAEYWEGYYNLAGSVSEFTGAARELEGIVLENTANEFFLGFAMNLNSDPQILRLFISTPEPNPVTFTVETQTGFSFTGTATSNSTTTVNLPISLQVSDSLERNKGIRVKAEGDQKIVVYGMNYESSSSDAFLALPCDRLAIDEYEYYAVTYQGSTSGGNYETNILVVGCENDTTVTLSSDTITLDQLETYLLESTGTLTGTKIVSNKPIAVFPGSRCTDIPFSVRACDTLIEQVPPTKIWGSSFLTASFLGRTSGERYRVLTGDNSTTVTVKCTTFSELLSISLASAGNWEEFATDANSFCSIEANHPVLVMEFGLGNDLDGIGDPFMTMIPPIEQYSNNYVFNVLPEFSTNYISVFVAPEYYQPDQIFVDSSNLQNSDWTEVFCSDNTVCGYITRVPLDSGEHKLYHEDADARIGVLAYGFNSFNSYGYPGGLRLVPVQLATVSFAASTYTVAENAGHVTIHVTRSGDTEIEAVVLVASENFVGTASAGIDYIMVTEILEFQPGETEKEITVEIINDQNVELMEEFELYLTSGAGVYLSPFPRAEVVITNDDGRIVLEPRYGSVLGGAAIRVSGEETFFILQESDEITCTLDGIEVEGIYIDAEHALCVSPRLTRTGRVPFKIEVLGKLEFLGETTFNSLSYTKAYEVYIDNEDLLLSSGSRFGVHWSPRSIFPLAEPGDYTVDILLLELDTTTEMWNELAVLALDIPNNGSTQVTIPELGFTESVEGSTSPVVVQVSVSSASTDENNTGKRGIISNLFKGLGKLAWRVVKNAPIRFAKKLARQAAQRALCELWGALQPNNIGQEILDRLPQCPLTATGARAPNSGFKEETLSSAVPVIDGIQDFFETTIIDDGFRKFFHPGTSSCFRQRVTSSSQTGGSGQQCCYDVNDQLVVGSPGGGTVDKVSPDVSFVGHFLSDVVPFLLCCKAGIFSDCDEYYEHRPSDARPLIPPPPPACVYGDPHIVTLDSHKYTFNGKGEFILIETVNGSFTLQGRMTEATDVNGTAVPATVFSALVSKENNSDTVQFELTENGTLIALVNGGQVDFTNLLEQEYTNVVVSDLGNSTLSASFSSGAYLETRQENGIISVLIVSLPRGAEDTPTQGLMGSFNGDKTDDLLPKAATDPLPLNATLQEIHEQFGVTWIIDTPTASLFSYQPGESWATYYDPYFVPHYAPTFLDSSLEAEADALCGGDLFCLFDVAATGSMDIGLSTLEGGQEFERIMQFSIPVVCDPPCENGACVANETCNCAAGYEGDRCTEPVFMYCDDNPCQNGGSCTKHVIDYICKCLPGYNGSFCENELQVEEEESDGTNAAVIGGVIGGVASALILAICVVVIVIVVLVKKTRKVQISTQPFRETVRLSDVHRAEKTPDDGEYSYPESPHQLAGPTGTNPYQSVTFKTKDHDNVYSSLNRTPTTQRDGTVYAVVDSKKVEPPSQYALPNRRTE